MHSSTEQQTSYDVSWLLSLPLHQRESFLQSLTDREAKALLHLWEFWARPNQLIPPGNWTTWLILAGRGNGKTRTGAETIRRWVETGKCARLALVADDAADARDVMVEGESGILAVSSPHFRPKYEPSKRRLTWPNGAIATTYAAVDPDALRGPQHDGAWWDEPAKAKNAQETYDQLMLGLRLGRNPQLVATTTPRPTPLIRALIAAEKTGEVVISRGKTKENFANLSPAFKRIISKYEGTRLGRQELDAEVLEDVEGALWTLDMIERSRIRKEVMPDLTRVVIAIDPAVTSGEGSAETGIIAVGVGWCDCKQKGAFEEHGFVLEDVSGRYSPNDWAGKATEVYYRLMADRVVAETNNGGEMVENTLRMVDNNVSYKAVHASRGKHTRAEPVSALYEQNKVHHVGLHPELEDQMTGWVPGQKSPDRLDALVWGLTDLIVDGDGVGVY